MSSLSPYQLTVLTTSQCTAECGHCSVNSAPRRRDRVTFDDIRKVIDQLHSVSPLKVVIFAGGEPTLLGDHLLDSIAYADSLGIITRVVTNAYWASSPAAARAKVRSLREAGLAEINISADDYHLPFIPFENVEHAWRACKRIGFLSVIIANCRGPGSRVTPDFIRGRLGEDIREIYDDTGWRQRLGGPAGDGTVYGISNAYLQYLGRAHSRLDASEVFPEDESSFDRGCPWAVKSAAISPKNHLIACCGFEVEHNEVLDFGDAREHAANDLLLHANNDVLVQAVARLGPIYLRSFIKTMDPTITFRDRYGSMCSLCEDIMTRPSAVTCLRDHARELDLAVTLAGHLMSISKIA